MILEITIALVQNAGLLLAIAVIFDLATGSASRVWSVRRKVFTGLAAGMIGVAMVAVAHTLEPGIIFDTRSVLLAVTGLFFGTLPTVIAMAMTAIARIMVGGIATWIGVSVVVASGLIGLLWRRLNRGDVEKIRTRDLYQMGLVAHVVMLCLLYFIPEGQGARVVSSIWIPVLMVHPLATVALGTLLGRRVRRQRSEDEVRAAESRFRALAENASDLVYRYELVPESRFTYVSPSATTITGYTPDEHYADPDLGFKLIHPDDREMLTETVKESAIAGKPLLLHWIRKDGSTILTEQRNTPVFDDSGRVVAIEGIARDVTEARRAADSLRDQEKRLRLALSGTNQVLFDLDIPSGIATFSPEYATMLGYGTSSVLTETREEWLDKIHPGDRERAIKAEEDYIAGRSSEYRLESRRRRRDGEWIWTLSHGTIIGRDPDGRPLRGVGTIQDITALKQAELEAREAEALAQSTLDALTDHICVLDAEGRVVGVNAAWRAFAAANGAKPGETFMGANYLLVCRNTEGSERQMAEEVATGLTDVLEGRRATFVMEYPCHSPHEHRWFRAQVTRFPQPGPARVVIAHENITDRMLAELEFRKVLRAVEQSPVSIVITDLDARIEYVNPRFVATTGYTHEELIGQNPRILKSGLTPPERYRDLWRTITRGEVWEGIFANRKKSGEIYYDQATIAPIRGVRGEIVGYVGAKLDITERMAADEDRARLTRILEISQSNAKIGSWELDLVRGTLFLSDETYRILDVSPDSFEPTVENVLALLTPESAAEAAHRLETAITAGVTLGLEADLVTSSGDRRRLEIASTATMEDGRPIRITGSVQDVTDRNRAERERLDLTKRLSQAQKLDSLGSLAGGVAHDLNNVLAAINNVVSAQRRRLTGEDPTTSAFDTIARACERGRSVINSLLYFARENVEARGAVDLNAVAREVSGLLDHTTLKRARLTTELEEPLGTFDGDTPGITQAVMNLCLNSLDAMPDGGTITIRTRNLAQDRVALAVIDNGFGMTEEVRERAVDPFFTTKSAGKGTGLGLAMVYGTAASHGGALEIRSEPGHGTEVTMTFPTTRPVAVAGPGPGHDHLASPTTRMQILLVDDDELILETFVPLLEALGHDVTARSSGPAALEALHGGLQPDLVILDMNMPGMRGSEALPLILELRPTQRVLICTGYSDDDLTALRNLSAYVSSIRKPFTVNELQDAMSELMGRS